MTHASLVQLNENGDAYNTCFFLRVHIHTSMCYVYIYVIYKNGMNCLNIGNAAKIENVLLPKTNVPIVLDDAMLLDDGLKYDNNDNDLYANNE